MRHPTSEVTGVDIVVVTHETRELTLRCVESILDPANSTGLELSLTVVDNASTDGTATAIAQRWARVRVLRNADNAGYASACNQGLRGGSADFVLILNSDVLARPGAIPRLIAFLRDGGEHVAAGGRLVDPGTDRVQVGHNVRGFPRLFPQLAQMLGLERRWPANPLSRRYLMLDLDYGRTQDVDQPAGSCLACRRSAFDAIAGFDEGFFYWFEDVDLVRRLHDVGRVAYVHDAVFEHVGGATFDRWQRPERILTWYRSLFRYFAKHRPRRERAALRAAAALLAGVRMLVAIPLDRERARALGAVVGMALLNRPTAPRREG